MLSVSLLSTTSRRTDCVSTIGDAPVTVSVSSSAPTRRSAFTVITPEPETSTPSRFTVLKPASVNVTLYVPGSRSVMRYCPVPSLTTVRVFSMSTGLDASTVTPGSTAADASRMTPAIVAWANTTLGSSTSARQRCRHIQDSAHYEPPYIPDSTRGFVAAEAITPRHRRIGRRFLVVRWALVRR